MGSVFDARTDKHGGGRSRKRSSHEELLRQWRKKVGSVEHAADAPPKALSAECACPCTASTVQLSAAPERHLLQQPIPLQTALERSRHSPDPPNAKRASPKPARKIHLTRSNTSSSSSSSAATRSDLSHSTTTFPISPQDIFHYLARSLRRTMQTAGLHFARHNQT